jgi:hypothetical protein
MPRSLWDFGVKARWKSNAKAIMSDQRGFLDNALSEGSAMQPLKGADLLVRALENEGVECIFGLPGEENLDSSKRCAPRVSGSS